MRVNHHIHLGEGSIVCPFWKHFVNTIACLGTCNLESLCNSLMAQVVLAGQIALAGGNVSYSERKTYACRSRGPASAESTTEHAKWDVRTLKMTGAYRLTFSRASTYHSAIFSFSLVRVCHWLCSSVCDSPLPSSPTPIGLSVYRVE